MAEAGTKTQGPQEKKRLEIFHGYPPTVDQDTVRPSKKNGDVVQWHSSDPNWTVDFDGDSPFADSFFDRNHDTGAVKADAVAGKNYKYTVTAGGTNDPGVIIDP